MIPATWRRNMQNPWLLQGHRKPGYCSQRPWPGMIRPFLKPIRTEVLKKGQEVRKSHGRLIPCVCCKLHLPWEPLSVSGTLTTRWGLHIEICFFAWVFNIPVISMIVTWPLIKTCSCIDSGTSQVCGNRWSHLNHCRLHSNLHVRFDPNLDVSMWWRHDIWMHLKLVFRISDIFFSQGFHGISMTSSFRTRPRPSPWQGQWKHRGMDQSPAALPPSFTLL